MKPKEIKKYRTRLSKTQNELAEDLGVHQSQISRWERGLQKIPRWAVKYFERVG